MPNLVGDLEDIIQERFIDTTTHLRIKRALERYEWIMYAVRNSSLAQDGMEMIEAASRELEEEEEEDD